MNQRNSAVLDDMQVRNDLMAAFESVRDVIVATAAESESLGYLAPRAVEALNASGLSRMRVPTEAGGQDASPATEMLVLIKMAELDVATAWNAMVMNNSTAFIAAFLPEPGFSEVFGNGVPNCAGVAPPTGQAIIVEGGFRLTGRWRLCSGVRQAKWVRLTTMTREDKPRRLFTVVPQSALTIIDSWDVIALAGTGSNDVELKDHFVPAHMTIWEEKRLRGGPQHRQRGLIASSYEHTGIAIGIAERALREAAEMLTKKTERNDVHLNSLGRLRMQLDSTLSHVLVRLERDYNILADPAVDADKVGVDNLAMSAYATDLARDCVEFAYRLAGAAAMYKPNIFERLLRDVHGATQHVGVHSGHYTDLGARTVAAIR
jgi:alkylation response protein AidB-like acyl-CoA dehydrogenase